MVNKIKGTKPLVILSYVIVFIVVVVVIFVMATRNGTGNTDENVSSSEQSSSETSLLEESSQSTSSSETSVIESESSEEESSQEESNEVDPTSDNVIEQYAVYKEFEDFWYRGGSCEACTDEIIKYNNQDYCRYETEDIKSYADFKALALTIMSEDLWNNLQKTIEYIDRDGALYGPVNYGIGAGSQYAGYECEAVRLTEGSFELVVDHYYYLSAFVSDAEENERIMRGKSTLLFEKTGDGWRFTSNEYKTVSSVLG